MAFKSAGVTTRTIEVLGGTGIQPIGTPAGVIGTAQKGKAYVPATVATAQDMLATYGNPTNEYYNGPLAATEWLRNQQSATYLRVLGIGKGRTRETTGLNQGRVDGAGFIVGNQLPQESLSGGLGSNSYANSSGVPGRTHFLITMMSESAGSSIFRDAGKPGFGVPVVRGVLITPSGVIATLSNSYAAAGVSNTPTSTTIAGTNFVGDTAGTVNLNSGRQEFTLILAGHKGTDTVYPNVISASFDPDAPNYFGNMFNKDPYKIEQAGHCLYADYVIDSAYATVTGSGAITGSLLSGYEPVAFIVTGSVARNSGSTTAPDFENFEDRYKAPKSPWVISQKFGGKPENLFRIHSLDDGSWANNRLKLTIENITPGTDSNPYGVFDLVVRSWDDTDKDRVIYEAFRSLSLNPSSTRFIGKIIGDINTFFNWDAAIGNQKIVTEGDNVNLSRYIRVEIAEKILNEELDPSALPFGFRGMPHLVTSGSAPLATYSSASMYSVATPLVNTVQIPVPFRENLTLGSTNKIVDKSFCWGVQFNRKSSVTEPNGSVIQNDSLKNMSLYYPDYHTDFINVVVSNNQGTPDTAENGILDADRFNNNLFTLSNVKITYTPDAPSSTTGEADTQTIVSWSYVRAGNVTADGTIYRELRASDLSDSAVRQVSKFSFFMQGGFNGLNMFNQSAYEMTNRAITEEMDNTNRGVTEGATVTAYDRAIDIMADATETDIQLLAIPGIKNSIITDKAILNIENRFDAFYIMDLPTYDTSNNVVYDYDDQISSVRYTITNFQNRGLNSSFGAAYFPDVKLRDEFTGTTRTVAASTAVLGAFGKNDAVGYPWFAPAGFTRGALPTTQETVLRLNRQNLDDLQEANINPIVSFPGSEGTVVWGQKTLLDKESQLERVNVRRLMIELRRRVRKVANRIIFEAGRAETLANFENLVRPILKQIQDQNGVSKYLVKIDTTTTTQADIENRTIRGKIFVAPTKTLEFLDISFVLTNNANFAISG